MQHQIISLLKKSLQKLELENTQIPDIFLETPENTDHGDFSCNIAMQLVKILKKNPRQIATEILENIPENSVIAKSEIAGPGFLNFFVSSSVYNEQLQKISELGENFGKNEVLKNQKFLAEHTDPNLFKEVHVGHVMTNTIGESLYRIAKFSGAETKNVTFQGDVGMHIAKALWGIQNIGEDLPLKKTAYEKQKFLGKCYVFGEKNYSAEDTPSEQNKAKQEIITINRNIYIWNRYKNSENSENTHNLEISEEVKKLGEMYEMGCKWSLEYLETIYSLVGSKFDHYFLESSTFTDGQRIVEENTGNSGKKVFVTSENSDAVIFEGENYGFHTRVFINSEGLPTYEAKDIGLFHAKWKKYNPDISLTVTGGDQDVYFKTVREAAGLINPEWKAKTVHVAHGTLKLTTGKMSSRTGKIVRAQDWIDSAREHLEEKMQSRVENGNIEKSEISDIAKKIAIGAIKYAIIKVSAGKDIVYDPETALDFTGNSGPYLQYSYVRAQSILRKSESVENSHGCSLQGNIISDFQKILNIFPEAVEKSLKNYSSHHIANYLYEACKAFNSFYAHTKILDTANPDYKKNLVLVEVFSHVMKNGLHLLGIETVEKM